MVKWKLKDLFDNNYKLIKDFFYFTKFINTVCVSFY